ncbi:MAG: hypothetical protein D6722_25245, partial [Bacteroidetes bacterium]
QALFPDRTYRDARLRHLMEELSRALEAYVAWREMETRPATRRRMVLQGLGRRLPYTYFQRVWRRFFPEGLHQHSHEEQGLRENLDAALIGIDVAGKSLKDASRPQQLLDLVQEGLQALDTWHMSLKLNFTISLISLGHLPPQDGLSRAQLLLDDPTVAATPAWMGIYLDLLRLVGRQPIEMDRLSLRIEHWRPYMPPDLVQTTYLLSYNYLSRAYRKRYDQAIGERLLRTMRLGMERGWLRVEGVLDPHLLRSLVFLVIQVVSPEAARQDLRRYLPWVGVEHREECAIFNQALCDFYAGDLRQALATFSVHRFRIEKHEHFARCKVAHAQYLLSALPLNEPDRRVILNQVRNLKRSLRVAVDLDKPMRQRYQRHLKYFVRLLDAHSPADRQAIRQEVEQDEAVFDRAWLLQALR